jgi:hypothetical protein
MSTERPAKRDAARPSLACRRHIASTRQLASAAPAGVCNERSWGLKSCERQEEPRAADAAQWSGCCACKACSKATRLTLAEWKRRPRLAVAGTGVLLGPATRSVWPLAQERKKERKSYARCQACVKGALASKSHRRPLPHEMPRAAEPELCRVHAW